MRIYLLFDIAVALMVCVILAGFGIIITLIGLYITNECIECVVCKIA